MNEIEKVFKWLSARADYITATLGQPAYILDALVRFDIVGIFENLLRSGWYIDPETKKITPGQQGLRWDVPWIYVHPDPSRYCDLYTEIFNKCGFVPSACMACWKVVIKPRTVRELIELLVLQSVYSSDKVITDRWCKCGVEERAYVPQHYGGYFYCDSKKSVIERYEEVRELVSKQISPDVPVVWKRYCTEMELKLGPSDKYERPELARAIEHEIMSCVNRAKPNIVQPPYVVRHIIKTWSEFAWDRADTTAADVFNGGQPFYTPSVTYHNNTIPEETKKS